MPEYGNCEITHNVEFTLHRVLSKQECDIITPLTYKKASQLLNLELQEQKIGTFIDRNGILKNSAVLGNTNNALVLCNLIGTKLQLSFIQEQACAMFECKRVGVEEGQKKDHKQLKRQNKELMLL